MKMNSPHTSFGPFLGLEAPPHVLGHERPPSGCCHTVGGPPTPYSPRPATRISPLKLPPSRRVLLAVPGPLSRGCPRLGPVLCLTDQLTRLQILFWPLVLPLPWRACQSIHTAHGFCHRNPSVAFWCLPDQFQSPHHYHMAGADSGIHAGVVRTSERVVVWLSAALWSRCLSWALKDEAEVPWKESPGKAFNWTEPCA